MDIKTIADLEDALNREYYNIKTDLWDMLNARGNNDKGKILGSMEGADVARKFLEQLESLIDLYNKQTMDIMVSLYNKQKKELDNLKGED